MIQHGQVSINDAEDEAIANRELGIDTMLVKYHYDRERDAVVCEFALFD